MARMTYTHPSDKRQDTLTLGLYPEFGLADAREWRDEIRAKLARGENPKALANDLDAHFRFETRLVEWHTRWASMATANIAPDFSSTLWL